MSIEEILHPTVLSSLRDVPPVKCIIWKGNESEEVSFPVYPFDTLDDIKRMICAHYKVPAFIPKFVFVGIPQKDFYMPLDYLWYPNGTNDPKMAYALKNPKKLESDMRFISSDGSWAGPNNESRGRSTIEQVLKNSVLHVFPLEYLLKGYKGAIPIGEEEWNKRFAPYFPDIKVEGPFEPDKDDIEFAKKIRFFIEQREKGLDKINRLLEGNVEIPIIKVTGVKQMRLTWKKPVKGFEGCGYMFYRLPVTEKRPYLRLLPSEGSAITKLHVKGILPIPSLEDPRVLEQWGKEASPTSGFDFCTMKYIHRQSMGITQPIYGTVQIYNDGTINLLLLPPKQIRKLDPILDFRNFNSILENVFEGLPQDLENFELKEIATLFSLKTSVKSQKFNKARILQRLPYFQTFFQEIKPLPDETPIISLRYKAVSQFISEDKTFAFLTQYSTSKMLEGESATFELINVLQDEFQLSKKEAIEIVAKWFEQRGTFTVQIPEDGEFIESFNPGIDIHIYSQHPSYYFHVNRIDSYKTYTRVFTLLSLLFMEDDYFTESVSLQNVSAELEEESLHRETKSTINKETASTIPDWIADDPFADSNNAVQNDQEVKEEKEEKYEKTRVTDQRDQRDQKDQRDQRDQRDKKDQKDQRDQEEEKLVNPKSWFIKKLQEIDPRLFNFRTEDTDENGYSRKCAGYDDRQPSVLTKDQYERMREIYEEDPIFWIVYPLEGTDEPIQPLGMEETITIMKYGSDQESINYYFCPQYYCLNDEIMIRPIDFESITDRDGKRKSANTCPFCHGRLITDKKKANPGYTVIKRKDKKGATFHSYIDFMSKSTHPEGFALPCCFLKQNTLRISDPKYAHLRSFLQETELENIGANTEEYEELLFKGEEAIEYAVLFETLPKKYILESNKHPDAGIFATVPPNFDKFFKQSSSDTIVTRVAIHLKLRPNAQGFLRIGTENTIYESLFGVIAPLIYKNSIDEVRQRIIEVVNPRIFLNSHFGNLVLEFYNPADGRAMPPTNDELRSWASEHLGIAVNSTNNYALIRLYNSHKRFINFINDRTQRKDLRHIQPILAEPGLFTTRGIQLIVMEDADPITIKCPSLGLSMDRHKKNDFAFISRTLKNIGSTENTYARYELYLHTSNKAAKGGEIAIGPDPIIKWDFASRRYWPKIVVKRIDEYITQCQSRYRSLYTSQIGINPMAIIPLSKAVNAGAIKPEGIIKDSYNHIVGVTYRSKPGSSFLVTLPVVDDGVISISSAFSVKSIYLDWEDYKPAPADDIITYYKNNLETLFALYPGYKIKYIVKQHNKVVALQLENGIYIPSAAPKEELKLGVVNIDQFEWSINKQISLDKCGVDTELVKKSSYSSFEELYQQFRLMVSNWITSNKAGSEIRKGIEDIIFNKNLPDYEKRKRLYIFISSTLLSWFYPDTEKWESPTSFLRKDCRLIDSPEACSGSCYWKDTKCLLHVDATTQLGERDVSTPELFTKRIIDELVRFPIRRKQIMAREISKVSTIVQPIRQGDQYIIPESSPTWTNLLRLDWAKQIPEEVKYYEEMSREGTTPQVEGNLTPELEEMLGKDTTIRLSKTYDNLKPFQGILGITLSQIGLPDNSQKLGKENLILYVKQMLKPVGIIENNTIHFTRPATGSFDVVTIFVFLGDQIGLLVEEEGEPTVKISSLPENIQELYKKASIVQIKKEEVNPVNPVNPVKKRRPLVAMKSPKSPKSPKKRRPRVAE